MTATTTTPAPPDAGGPRPDPRFPWKTKGTRKPLSLWDRGKFLLLIALLFHLLVWNEFVRFAPPETWWDAEAQVAYNQQWLLWLAGIGLRITILAVPPVIPLIRPYLGMSETQVGILTGLPPVLFA